MSIGRNGSTRTRLRVEWPTVALIAACYCAWALAGIALWPQWPLAALAVMTLAVALHSSLMHEASHGHPTRSSRLNELLVALPIGLIYPYRRFKALHLRHHADERLTDPFDDPESYYRALWHHDDLPAWLKALLKLNNTMAGRFVIGPAIANVGFVLTDARLLTAGDSAVRRAWVHHLAGLVLLLPIVTLAFDMTVLVYVIPVYLGQSLIAIRTFAEHQWSERPDGRTIIVERSPLAFLFLNNNLHLVHHKMPSIAWYQLPAAFRARRADWLAMNEGYAYPNYLALLKDYAFKAKEPVVHPVLRRAPEQGRAFTPRIRVRNVGGLGTATVPAEPPKE
ncbi:fatty acid desaturase [Mesorhizobium sp. CAU 1741]|uniref:fatty acid desaturase n=1 Tax=Mesorhizobium sp. CAU 1741 TaxID=3140366 RepID=UPI00325ACDB1